jgi:hypothetical protein
VDRLEHYLDQVCRSIGGPRALRQHVRQELREHLLDAAAGHRAAGASEEAALERALEDFGGPEQVRAELEATHGHRLLPVVIDKAMQWKEMTMRAKWLWMAWAYLATAGVVAVNLVFLFFAGAAAFPKLQKLDSLGWLDNVTREQPLRWFYSFLDGVNRVRENALWYAAALAALWGLFEWRVRGENKSLMRLAALGTAALVLSVVVFLTGAALVLPFELGMPGMVHNVVRPLAAEQLTSLDASATALDRAIAAKDWEAMRHDADRASRALDTLEGAIAAVVSRDARLSSSQLRERLGSAKGHLREARQAIGEKDADRLGEAMRKFHADYGQVRAATEPAG